MARHGIELPNVEDVAAKVHDAWMRQKRAHGVESRILDTTGEELMVPYEDLSPEAKALDRATVCAVYDALHDLGIPVYQRVEN